MRRLDVRILRRIEGYTEGIFDGDEQRQFLHRIKLFRQVRPQRRRAEGEVLGRSLVDQGLDLLVGIITRWLRAGESGGAGGSRSMQRAHFVDLHRGPPAARRLLKACSSQRMRMVNKTPLSTVNTKAVTQAPWISGRAIPSATTAT